MAQIISREVYKVTGFSVDWKDAGTNIEIRMVG